MLTKWWALAWLIACISGFVVTILDARNETWTLSILAAMAIGFAINVGYRFGVGKPEKTNVIPRGMRFEVTMAQPTDRFGSDQIIALLDCRPDKSPWYIKTDGLMIPRDAVVIEGRGEERAVKIQ